MQQCVPASPNTHSLAAYLSLQLNIVNNSIHAIPANMLLFRSLLKQTITGQTIIIWKLVYGFSFPVQYCTWEKGRNKTGS